VAIKRLLLLASVVGIAYGALGFWAPKRVDATGCCNWQNDCPEGKSFCNHDNPTCWPQYKGFCEPAF
jgi:hypothetical protein